MKSSKKLKSFSKSFSTDGSNINNMTLTLPSIHVTEPTEEGTVDLNELPPEIHYLSVPSERRHFSSRKREPGGETDDSTHSRDDDLSETQLPPGINLQANRQSSFKSLTTEDLHELWDSSTATENETGASVASLAICDRDDGVFTSKQTYSFTSLVPISSIIPPSLDEALNIVKKRDVMFYLKFKTLPSDVHYEPYEFSVVSSCPGNIYGILSHEGIIRILGNQVEFTTLERFAIEKEKYSKLRQLPFFRHFRLRRSWLRWRRSIRARKLLEAKTELSSHFLISNLRARKALSKVAHLCHELSKRCLVKFPGKESDAIGVAEWVEENLSDITDTHSKLTSFRSLILQILTTEMKVYESDEGSEFMSADQRGSPRSHSASSGLSRRHLLSLVMKIVYISDIMMANTLKQMLANSLTLTLTSLEKKGSEASESIFRIEVSISEGSIKCNPNFEGFLNGIRTVMKACEVTVLSCAHLAAHFAEKESPAEENKILRSVLEGDSTYKETAAKLQPLMQSIWKNTEEDIESVKAFHSQVKAFEEDEKERALHSDELSGLGDWLGGVGKLLDAVKDIADNTPVGVMWVEKASAKSVLVEVLKKQQQLIHQNIIKTFERRNDLLDKQATDAWLGLELSPVTAHQLVSLLNYVIKVKNQMDSLSDEETTINQMFSLMQSYEITIQPEAQTKYDTLCKDMRRLRKTLRRSTMERPGLVNKLKVLLESEVSDLDKETEKLTEQVQALRFLRITSDRNEVLKMLSAAEKRSINIRSQATTIIQYQKDFELEVCPFSELEKVEVEVGQKTRLWRSLFEWEAFVEECLMSEVRNMDAAFIKTKTMEYKGRVSQLRKVIEESEVLDHFDYLVKIIENQIPILEAMTDPTLRPRHWQELEEATSTALPDTLTFADAERLGLKNYTNVMVTVASNAQKQKDMEDRLQKVSEDLKKAAIPLQQGYKRDLLYLGNLTDLEDLFVKSDLIFYSLLHSEYAFHIKETAVTWENNFILMKKTLKSLTTFEEKWKLLEPVMCRKSAIDAFPMQVAIFDSANKFWKKTIANLHCDPVLLNHIKGGHFFQEVDLYRNNISELYCCLESLLAIRRNTCPRLYLLPDEELINLLTMSQVLESCEKYLPMIFPGVASFHHNSEGNITALVSPEGEVLHLTKTVLAHHGVEDWMSRAESGMKATLKRLVLKHCRDSPLPLESDVPIQVIDVCRRIQWNRSVQNVWASEHECSSDNSVNEASKGLSELNQELFQEMEKIVRSQHTDISEVINETAPPPSTNKKANSLVTITETKIMAARTRKMGFSMTRSLNKSLIKDTQQNFLDKLPLQPNTKIQKLLGKIQRKRRMKGKLSYCRKKSYILTLLELRDMTQRLMEESSEGRSSFMWMSNPRYRCITSSNPGEEEVSTESSGRVGVVVDVGTDVLDYGFEYYGIPQPALFCPHTNRSFFNLIAAASRSKCATIVGSAGSGKAETVRAMAKAVGQNLSIFSCSCQTPAKSIRQLMSAGVQGGLWVMLKEPQTLTHSTLGNLVQSLISIYRSRDTSNKRCIVDGQEMKMMDSFALFLSLTNDKNNEAATKVDQFFSQPITPFLKAMSSSLPTVDSVIEAVTLASGFTLSDEFRNEMKTILVKTSSEPFNVTLISSYIKSVKIITALAKKLQNSFLESSQQLGSTTVTDEFLVASSTRDFLFPLIQLKQVKEWESLFNFHFGSYLEFHKNHLINPTTSDIYKQTTNKTSSLEIATFKLLLMLGYRKVKNVAEFIQQIVSEETENFLELNGDQINDLKETNGSKMIGGLLEDERHETPPDAVNMYGMPISINEEKETLHEIDSLCQKGKLLYNTVLRLHSILQTHKCCCIVGSQASLNFPIWMMLKMARNILNNKLLMEDLSPPDQRTISGSKNVSNDPSKTTVRSFVLHCGAYTTSQMVGTDMEGSDGWKNGILFKMLKDLVEECATHENSEHWLILSGPFSSSVMLESILSLCQMNSSFKDEGFYEVILNRRLRVIIEIDEKNPLEACIMGRVPVLFFRDEPQGLKEFFVKKVTDIVGDKILEGNSAISTRIDNLIRSYVTDSSVNFPLKQLSATKAFERAGKIRSDKKAEEITVDELLQSVQSTLQFVTDCRTGFYSLDENSRKAHKENGKQLNCVVSNDMIGCSDAIKFILDNFSDGIILFSHPGEGLTTFLDFLHHRLRNDFEIYEFRAPLMASCEKFVEFVIESLYSHHPPLEKEVDDAADYLLRCSKHFADYGTGEIVLAPPQTKEGILIINGLDRTLDGSSSSPLIQLLRFVLRCQTLIHPKTKRRYRVERIRFILNIRHSFYGKADERSAPFENRLLPEEFLKYCSVLSLPKASHDLKLELIKTELESLSTEIQEEHQRLIPLVEAVMKFHGIASLGESSSLLDKKEKAFYSRIKNLLLPKNYLTSSDDKLDGLSYVEKEENTCSEVRFPSSQSHPISRLFAANLSHLMRFVKALGRNNKLLTYPLPEIGFVFCTEAHQIYNFIPAEASFLSEVLEYIYIKYFEVKPELNMFLIPKLSNGNLENCLEQTQEGMTKLFKTSAEGFDSLLISKEILRTIQSITLYLTETGRTTHLILEGETGVGKSLLLKLSLRFISYSSYNLNEAKGEEAQIEILRAAVKSAGIEGKPVAVISRIESLGEITFSHIFSLVEYGWSEDLWPKYLIRGILFSVEGATTKDRNYINYLDENEFSLLKQKLLRNIQKNLHICLRGTQKDVSQLLKNYSSFSRKFSVVHIDTWTTETLKEVAEKIIGSCNMSQNILNKILLFLPQVHRSLKCGFQKQKKRRPLETTSELYAVAEEGEEEKEEETADSSKFKAKKTLGVTEQDYLECCHVFMWLLKRRKTELKNKLTIYREGFMRLESTTENIEELRSELGQLEPDLKTTQDEAQHLTSSIAQQRNTVADLRTQMTDHEGKLKEKTESVASLNDEIANDVKHALPEVESTEKQIKAMDKKELVEVRMLNKPPDLILQVMSAVCLLLNVKADWSAIKTLLGDPTMTTRLLELEKDSLNDATLRKLRSFVEYPKFNPDEVGKLSKPCRPLCAWLRALDNYCQALRNVEPKRGRVIEAERVLNNLLVEQRQLHQRLGQAERTLSEQGARYDACVCRRQQLEGAVKRSSGRLQRCTRLTTVLADEHTRWQIFVKQLEDQMSCIYGECLLAAIVVAYLGHLEHKEREGVLSSCFRLLESCNLKMHRKNFNLLENLSTPDERKKLIGVGLDNDPIPFIQVSILMASQRPPLVLDVHQCLMPWLLRIYEGSSELAVLHAGQKDFLKTLLNSVKSRKVTVVSHTLLKGFDPQMKMALNQIKKEMKAKRNSDENRLIFVSESTSDIPSDLRVYVTPISFAMAPKVLEERLLNKVFKSERIDLFVQRATLNNLVSKDEEALETVEISILKKLAETTLGLLDNEEILAVFYEAKTTSAEYRTRLAESKRTLQKIGNARDKYRPVAARGRILFSTVGALRIFAREYVFSLRFFLNLFDDCIKAGGDDEEMTLSFDQRIETLVLTLTQKMCIHVKRALDSSDHQFVFLAALAALVSHENGELSLGTWKAVMKKDVTHKERFLKNLGKTEEDIKYLSERLSNGETLRLSLYNIPMDITALSKKRAPSFVPRKITNFNILLILRFYKPKMLLPGIREVIKNVLTDASLLEKKSTLEEMLMNSKERTSGILLWTNYSGEIVQRVSEWARGQGIEGMVKTFIGSTKDTCNKEVGTCDIPSAIESAIRLGGALIIQNCAAISWSPAILDQITCIATTNTKVHQNFRLIFSTQKSETINDDLILLTRPLQTIPSPDLRSILSESAKEIDMEIYDHHYQGGTWRRIVWMAAAVHSLVYVDQFWKICSKLALQDPERGSVNRPSQDTSEFNQWVQLKDIKLTFDVLYKYSLEECLTEQCVVSILECLYGKQDLWANLTIKEGSAISNSYASHRRLSRISSLKYKSVDMEPVSHGHQRNNKRIIALPEEVGIVTKTNAQRMTLKFLISQFPDLHQAIVENEFETFKMNFARISNEIINS